MSTPEILSWLPCATLAIDSLGRAPDDRAMRVGFRVRALAFVSLTVIATLGVVGGCKYADDVTPIDGGTAKPASSSAPRPEVAAYALVEQMGRGDWDGVVKHFSPDVAKAVTAAQLKDAWTKSMGEAGAYQAVGGTSVIDKKARILVRVKVALTKGTMEVLLGYAPGDDKVLSLHIQPAEVAPAYDPPAYVDATRFEARDIVVGRDALALPGTLVVPRGPGTFPAVILENGSGGGDRNESSGPTLPFRDIAEGLASRGIIVLRFDKRTHGLNLLALPITPAELTVKEEYFDDLSAAIDLLHHLGMVDQKHIFVVGHSEGGWLVPWFLKLHPDLRGGILLAGHARWFADLLEPQREYMAKLSGQIDPVMQKTLDEIKAQAAHAKDPLLTKDTPPAQLPLGIPAPYWLSLQGYDAVAVAHADPRPLLILQGGRDYQVTVDDDLSLWKKGLADKPNVEFHVYPKVNHLFFAGEGPITPAEYLKLGHVEADVIDDLAAWVKKQQ